MRRRSANSRPPSLSDMSRHSLARRGSALPLLPLFPLTILHPAPPFHGQNPSARQWNPPYLGADEDIRLLGDQGLLSSQCHNL